MKPPLLSPHEFPNQAEIRDLRYDETGTNTYKKTLAALRTSIDLQRRNLFGN